MRVFLDTNVLVSAVATRGLCADILNTILAEHELVVGQTVLNELRRVLRTKMGVPREIVEEMDSFLRREAVIIRHARPLEIPIRDETDEPILAEAVAGAADVLVTGDHDLLVIAATAPIRILAPRGFWNVLRSGPGAVG